MPRIVAPYPRSTTSLMRTPRNMSFSPSIGPALITTPGSKKISCSLRNSIDWLTTQSAPMLRTTTRSAPESIAA